MLGFNKTIAVIVLMFIFGVGSIASAQSLHNFLDQLKVGEWVEVEGVPQNDASLLIEEIKVIYGELEEDDYEINGIVDTVLPGEKKIFILNLPVVFDKYTEYDDKHDAINAFADIKTGNYVEIEGSFLRDSTFLAKEIGLKKSKKKEQNIFEWRGKVQSVNPANNSLVILGHTVILTPGTKIKSFTR